MRSLLLALVLACSCYGTAISQTLFTYGTHQITKDEFLRAYNKNNTAAKNDEQAYRDYLQLYTKFKLKVQAALDQRLDTLPSQKAELQNFRQQVLPSFLDADGFMQQMVDEAFDRSQKDLHLAHIYIPIVNADSASAKKKADEAYAELHAGGDFSTVAIKFSGDPAVKINKGDLGYITVFTLPYAMETVAYTTAVGQFSTPFKSKTAYHIFKVVGDRPSIGRMRIAQIFLAFPPDATEAVKMQRKKTADSLYASLRKGAAFDKLAEKFSQDNASYLNGGVMPEFGAGRFDGAFEEAVFALDHDSAVSMPIAGRDGYHIVKRINHISIPKSKDDPYFASLKQQTYNDSRRELSRQMMVRNMYMRLGVKRQPINTAHVMAYADSASMNKKRPKFNDANAQTPLFVVDGKQYSVNDWLKFLKTVRGYNEENQIVLDSAQLNAYLDRLVTETYQNNLEKFNPEFARQMSEFKEGNLLFRSDATQCLGQGREG